MVSVFHKGFSPSPLPLQAPHSGGEEGGGGGERPYREENHETMIVSFATS